MLIARLGTQSVFALSSASCVSPVATKWKHAPTTRPQPQRVARARCYKQHTSTRACTSQQFCCVQGNTSTFVVVQLQSPWRHSSTATTDTATITAIHAVTGTMCILPHANGQPGRVCHQLTLPRFLSQLSHLLLRFKLHLLPLSTMSLDV